MKRETVIGIIVLIIGIVLIWWSMPGMLADRSYLRQPFSIYSAQGTTTEETYSVILDTNHEFQIDVDMKAASERQDSTVDGLVVVYIDGVQIVRKQLYAYSYFDVEDGSFAWDFFTYIFFTNSTVNFTLSLEMSQGDRWEINFYRDVPEYIEILDNLIFPIFLIGFFSIGIGPFILMVSRAIEKSKKMRDKMEVYIQPKCQYCGAQFKPDTDICHECGAARPEMEQKS